jgi:protein-S-isoprenylcysteine O-methyltransferase Ste14
MRGTPTHQIPGWVTVALFAAFAIADWLLPDGDNVFLGAVGVLLLATSVVFMFVPFSQLAKYGEAESNYMDTKAVADRGLYAIVRHPQYLGYVLLFLGFSLLSNHWVTYLIAAVGIAVLYTQTVAEEKDCQTRFGSAYRDYMARVPRLNFILGLWRFLKKRPETGK